MKTDNIEIVEQVAATDPTQKTIQDYSITELKALVYDSIAIKRKSSTHE